MKKISLLFLLSFLIFDSCYKEVISDNKEVEPQNLPPTIQALIADKTELKSGEQINIKCVANDPDRDVLSYKWASFAGEFLTQTTSSSVIWKAPVVQTELQLSVSVKVQDGEHPAVSDNILFKVSPKEPKVQKLTLKAVEDTYIDLNSKDQNWGSRQDLQVSRGKIPYFKFNISSIPKNAKITKAFFRPIIGFNNSNVKPYGNVTFHHVSSIWSEQSLTYNNRILTGNNYVTVINNVKFDVAQILEVDVANELKNYIKNPPQGNELVYNRFSMKIESTDGGYFYSREVSGYEATIYVEYSLE